jgi:hypothetical protein
MLGGDVTRLNLSNATAAGLLEENPGVRATEALFSEFLTTVSAAGGRGVESSLDSIAEFEQTVADHVDVLRCGEERFILSCAMVFCCHRMNSFIV